MFYPKIKIIFQNISQCHLEKIFLETLTLYKLF